MSFGFATVETSKTPSLLGLIETPHIREGKAHFAFTIQNRSSSKAFIDRIFLFVRDKNGAAVTRFQMNSTLNSDFKEVYEPGEQRTFDVAFDYNPSELATDSEMVFEVPVMHSRSDRSARMVIRSW